jgi:hypothetical protein
LRPFPVGTAEPGPLGDHVMGMVVLAWLATPAVQRWGRAFMRSGTLSMTLERPMRADQELRIDHLLDATVIATSIDDHEGNRCVSATASLEKAASASFENAANDFRDSRLGGRIAATPDTLRNAVLPSIEFDFDAERDLAFLDDLPDSTAWHRAAWAHPAWLGTAVNAAIALGIDVGDPPRWSQIATELHLVAPIEHRERVSMNTRVARLSRRGRHDVAHLECAFHVGERFVAFARNDVIYRSDTQTSGA